MGCTQYDIDLLTNMIEAYKPKSVIELGAQNNYAQPNLPAPYMREWWEAKGILYRSIDLSGECGAITEDLSQPMNTVLADYEDRPFDFVTDLGTSEHIGIDGKFSWEAIYNCWKTKFDLCKVGGYIISENPQSGSWPNHGFNYYTFKFYTQLMNVADLTTPLMDRVPAMGNRIDGWNVMTVMHKVGPRFLTLEQFKLLDLRQS